MSKALSPMESEFATEEEAEAYDRWFRARVQASLDDPHPNIPHDEVITEMRRLVEDRRHEKDARRVAT